MAATFALAAVGSFAWWRLLLAAAVSAAVISFELGGARREVRSLAVLLGIGAVFAVILHVPSLAALFPVSLLPLAVTFGVLLFLCFGIVHVFFRGGGMVAGGMAVLLTLLAAFTFFSLFVPLSTLSLSFSLLLSLGLFLAVALPVGEVLAPSGPGPVGSRGPEGGCVPRRFAHLAGYAVGFWGAEAAFLLTFSSLSPLRLTLLLTLAVALSLRMVWAAARGTFSPRAGLWGIAAFLALFAALFLL